MSLEEEYDIVIIILYFDIAPFPYNHAQRRITFIVKYMMILDAHIRHRLGFV